MELNEIVINVRQKYDDAKLLKENARYANAIYLSGYCVELALKYAIAKHLNWNKFYTEQKFKFLKVHDLEFLVSLTGKETEIKQMPEWQIVKQWDEQKRYNDPTQSTAESANTMLIAVKTLVEMLCTNLS